MKINKKYKIYLSFLGLAAVAWAANSLIPTADNTAAGANTAHRTEAASCPVSPAIPSPAAADQPHIVLADQLAQTAIAMHIDLPKINDAFRIPATWFPRQPMVHSTPVVITQFDKTHTLNAIVAGNRGGSAIINGTPLRPGQLIDGYELVAVQSRAAILTGQGERVTLNLP